MTWFSNAGDDRGGIWCGDAFQIVDELVRLKGGPIADVVITDPPFGESTVKGARSGTTNPGDPQRKLIAGERQYAAWSPAQTLAYCELMGRAARRWVIVFTDYHYWPWLDGTIGTVPGLQWVRAGVWLKPNGTPQLTGDRPAHSFEAIAIMHVAGSRLRWNGGGGRAEWDMRAEAAEPDMAVAWRVPVERDAVHATRKPARLLRDLILQFSDPGETILDACAGSGSTLITALSLGRRALGVELDPTFARYAAAGMQAAPVPLFTGDGGDMPYQMGMEV